MLRLQILPSQLLLGIAFLYFWLFGAPSKKDAQAASTASSSLESKLSTAPFDLSDIGDGSSASETEVSQHNPR
jgi:hypothetical protein